MRMSWASSCIPVLAACCLFAGCSSDASTSPGTVNPGTGGGGSGTGGSAAGGTGGLSLIDGGTEAGAAGTGPDPCDVADPPPECGRLEASGPACGDAEINQTSEECDDGNPLPGDGCSGACTIEPFFECPTEGEPCVFAVDCGDGVVEGAEVCDDGNTSAGDGCAADCTYIEPGFRCDTPGAACASTIVCGDGRVNPPEVCDDGNSNAGDGCSADCETVEENFVCRAPGSPCTIQAECGDGILDVGEACDDGNTAGGDGCTATCDAVEQWWACPTPDAACVWTVTCGDGLLMAEETCDDGNLNSGDGCDGACQLESGWACPLPGYRCEAAACGDGILVGREECEDGNLGSGDGCDTNCRREFGYECEPNPGGSPPSVCHATTCNDGVHEGDEPCDDGNDIVGDGCNPFCEVEPNCPPQGGACSSRCGDGLILGTDNEECDDGNTLDGDGCSSTCQAEEGYQCTLVAGQLPPSVTIPFVFRDFVALPSAAGTVQRHPDFQNGCLGTVLENMVEDTLDAQGKPVNSGACVLDASCTPNVGYIDPLVATDCLDRDECSGQSSCDRSTHPNHPLATHPGDDPFIFWYRDTPGVNHTLITPVTLNSTANNTYQFDSGNFFPVDDFGWVTTGDEMTWSTGGHNFGFTSEVRYWFQFHGGEELTFRGDDDLFVFVNGKLALSIGSKHLPTTRTVVLNPNGTATCAACTIASRDLGIVPGNVYEIALFHAERQTVNSNFDLTLAGFVSSQSSCQPICGDGIVAGDEQCDNGSDNVNPWGNTYNQCTTECLLGPRCGDMTVQSPQEQCDDGVNRGTYGSGQCGPGCVMPPFCGDGLVQSSEACDDGTNDGRYGTCNPDCTLAPYCGDGIPQDPPEDCDDGVNDGASGCAPGCIFAGCGDGIVQPPEQCDDGVNDGAYGGCTPACTLSPYCGDSLVTAPPEVCDDGVNDGGYGQCAPGCVLGPYCGDRVVQNPPEVCDDGVNDGGYGQCAPGCVLGPFCGDGEVQAAYEECDDHNNIDHDGCSAACKLEEWVQ